MTQKELKRLDDMETALSMLSEEECQDLNEAWWKEYDRLSKKYASLS